MPPDPREQLAPPNDPEEYTAIRDLWKARAPAEDRRSERHEVLGERVSADGGRRPSGARTCER